MFRIRDDLDLKINRALYIVSFQVICGYFYKRKLKGRSEHEYEREGKDGDVVVSCNSVLAVDPPVDYNGDKIKVPTEVHLALVELT